MTQATQLVVVGGSSFAARSSADVASQGQLCREWNFDCGDLPLVVEGVGYGMGSGEKIFLSKFDLDVIRLNGNKKKKGDYSPLSIV